MAGYKTWSADDVLAAADLNSYLMAQAVPQFASAAVRSGAILSPAEGQLTYRIDGDVYELWNGSAWTALGGAIGTATNAAYAATATNAAYAATAGTATNAAYAATAGTATNAAYAATAGTATNASKVSNQTVFIQSTTPTANATNDIWFW